MCVYKEVKSLTRKLFLNVEGLMSNEGGREEGVKEARQEEEPSAATVKENELALHHLSQGLFFVQK